mgnify:FL=1
MDRKQILDEIKRSVCKMQNCVYTHQFDHALGRISAMNYVGLMDNQLRPAEYSHICRIVDYMIVNMGKYIQECY